MVEAENHELHWYALKVFYNKVFAVEEELTADGTECYVPVEETVVERGGQRRKVRRPVINSLMFFRAAEERARGAIFYQGMIGEQTAWKIASGEATVKEAAVVAAGLGVPVDGILKRAEQLQADFDAVEARIVQLGEAGPAPPEDLFQRLDGGLQGGVGQPEISPQGAVVGETFDGGIGPRNRLETDLDGRGFLFLGLREGVAHDDASDVVAISHWWTPVRIGVW
jgi:hypothetical protein